MSRLICTLFAVVVWALFLSRPGGFRRIFFEYMMRFTGSKKCLGEAEGKSHTHTHTHTHIRHGGSSTDGGNIRLSLSNSNSHAVSFHYGRVPKVIDLSPNLQTNILPALFSWPAAMLSKGQILVLMDFALVGTERVHVCHRRALLCLYE